MEPYWQLLSARLGCLGLDSQRVERHPALAGIHPGTPVVLRERDPQVFLEYFFAALMRGHSLWLASPDWQDVRLGALAGLCGPLPVLGGPPLPSPQPPSAPPNLDALTGGQPAICIPTGGTSGRLRFAVHTWDTLAAAATGFLNFFSQGPHRTLCTLPLYHVGGLMQAVRVLLSGGQLAMGSAHDPRMRIEAGFDPRGCFLSLVPTQLRRLLDDGAADWLAQFETIVVGGAAADPLLLETARAARLRLAPSYGMTETAAVAAALLPDEFLDGATGVGRALPHVRLRIVPQPGMLPGRGRVVIRARSLCTALIPGAPIDAADGLATNDIGSFDAAGRLHIHGRSDRVVISGGLKLDPGEIEDVLMTSGLVREVAVIGQADAQWGEQAVAYYVPVSPTVTELELRATVRSALSPAHVPKQWVSLAALPRNPMGKVLLAALGAAG